MSAERVPIEPAFANRLFRVADAARFYRDAEKHLADAEEREADTVNAWSQVIAQRESLDAALANLDAEGSE